MNRKETLIWSIIDNVIIACDIPRADGTHSITRESIVSKSREENVVMARALVVEQMVHAGFTITSGPEGKVYNAILYKSMIYPLGLNLKKHVVPGKNGTDWSNWKLFVEGQVIYDPDIKKMKLFNGEAWVNLDGTELA